MSLDADILPLVRDAEPSFDDPAPATARRRLRFLVCGSVDDGKSTLIGRLLWDTKSVAEDHQAALIARGSRQNDLSLPDFGLLLDGLKAEQEQGITIDVAYRYFQTARRAFIVADTPGHEQYTRNMATGASTADLAVLLVDARAGLLEQTYRHAAIAHLMGIRQFILAVNKIDLVNYAEARFSEISAEFGAYAQALGGVETTAIPLSALKGENIVTPARAVMPWYEGQTLLEALEAADETKPSALGFRMPIQRVSRPGESFRGYQGTIAAGEVRPGDRLALAPSGEEVTVTRITGFDGDRVRAEAGDAVTLVFDRPVDASRGDLLHAPEAAPLLAARFSATVVALQSEGLSDGARYWLKAAGRLVRARVTIREAYDLAARRWMPAGVLPVNAIGRITLDLEAPTAFDRFEACRETGAFILIGTQSNNTIAGGMVVDALDAGGQTDERVTLTLPRDLADRLLALPEMQARLAEIDIRYSN